MLVFIASVVILLCIVTAVVIYKYKWILPVQCAEGFEQVTYMKDSPYLAAVVSKFQERFKYLPSARQVLMVLRDAEDAMRGTPDIEKAVAGALASRAGELAYSGAGDAHFLLFVRDASEYKLDATNAKKQWSAFISFNKYLTAEVRNSELGALLDKARSVLMEHWDAFTAVCIKFQDSFIKVDSLDVNVRDYLKDVCDMIRCKDERVFLTILPVRWSEARNCQLEQKCSADALGAAGRDEAPSKFLPVLEALEKGAGSDDALRDLATDAGQAPVHEEPANLGDSVTPDQSIPPAPPVVMTDGDIGKILESLGKGMNVIVNRPTVIIGGGAAQKGDANNGTEPACGYGLGFHGIEELLPKSTLQANQCLDSDMNVFQLQYQRDMDLLNMMCSKGSSFNKADASGKLLPDQSWTVPQQYPPMFKSECMVQPSCSPSALGAPVADAPVQSCSTVQSCAP